MIKSIIILSGPVGAGKSTVARELANMLPGPVSYIEGDTFWSFVPKNTLGKNRVRNFKAIMVSMTAAAVPYAMLGYDVILDFSVPPWFLDTAKRIARIKKVPVDYVVLRPSQKVCAARAASRTEGTISDYSHYVELYKSFDEAERYIIDDNMSSATELASIISDGLKGGMFRLP